MKYRTMVFDVLSRLCAVVTLLAAAGCMVPRIEPPRHPRYVVTYEIPELHQSLGGLPVRLSLRDCMEKCVISSSTLFSGTETEPPMPLRPIVEREYRRLIEQNFTPADGDHIAKLELKVEPVHIDIRSEFYNRMVCTMKFSVKLLDPRDASVRPLFEDLFEATAECKDEQEEYVPPCVYKVIQECADRFLRAVSEDRELMRLMADLMIESPPQFISWSLKEMRQGEHHRGSTYISCKDWSKDETYKWSVAHILRRCQDELRLDEDDIRLFFVDKVYDERTRRWYFAFDATRKASVCILPAGPRRGRCLADMKELGTDEEGAKAIMRRRLIAESAKSGLKAASVELSDVRLDADNPGVISANYILKF